MKIFIIIEKRSCSSTVKITPLASVLLLDRKRSLNYTNNTCPDEAGTQQDHQKRDLKKCLFRLMVKESKN
jgi:hypothetical protein